MALTVSANKNWSDYEATSSTSLAITNGALTALSLTISTGKAYVAGDDIALVPTAAKIPMMLIGTVTSYDAGTGALVANCTRIESQISSRDLVSASSNTVGTGAKTFITYNGKSALLAASDNIMVGRRGTNGGNRMVGTVTSYDNANGTLVTNITSTIGSGTNQTDWIIVSSGTFSSWKVVPSPLTNITLTGSAVLTIDQEPSYPVGSFLSQDRGRVVVTNASTTTPWVIELGSRNTNSSRLFQLENNGRLDVTGAMITVKTGDGTGGQTVDLSGATYAKIDFPAIEVETGSGTGVYRPWYVMEDGANDRGYLGKNWVSRGYKGYLNAGSSATVTMTTASPTVITWTSHGLRPGNRVRFTTTGTFTGITAGTDYYVLVDSFTANSFKIGTFALTTTPVNVTAQSGTHTCTSLAEVGSGLHGNIALFNPTTRILRFGDGTNGNVIPNGAKVRIPNIHFTQDYARTPIMSAISSATAGNAVTFVVGNVSNIGTSTGMTFFINGEEFTGTFTSSTMTSTARALNGTVAANHAQGDTFYQNVSATSTTGAARALFDVADGGTVNLSKCSFGNFYLILTNGQNCTINNVWVTGGSSITSTTADATVNGLCANVWPQTENTPPSFSSILGATSLQNIYSIVTAFQTNQSSTCITISSLQNVTLCNNLEGVVTARNGTGTSCTGISITSAILNCTPTNLTSIGGRMTISGMSRFEMDGLSHSSELNGVVSSNVSTAFVNMVNCQNAVIRNISKISGGAATRSNILNTDANCSNVIFHTITYDAASNSNAIVQPAGNNIRVVNGTFGTFPDRGSTSSGTGAIANTSTGDTVTIQNCIFTAGDTYGADNGNGATARVFLEQTTGHSMWWRASGNAFNGNYQETGPFHVLLDNGVKNAGTLCAQFSVKSSRDIYTLNGGAYLNNGGSVFLPTTGDYIILKSYQNLRTITGFTGTVTAEDVNDANLSFSFEMVGHEASFANSFTALTTANLNTALAAISGYDDYDGFKIQIKIEAIADSATNQVINLRMFTTNNASTTLPIGYTAYTLTGLTANSTIAAYDGSTEVDYVASATGTATIQLPYDFDGTNASASIKVRCLDCNWDDHTASFNQYAFSRASLQTADTEVTVTNVATVAAYTDLGTPAKIYDYAKYWGSQRANMNVALPCTKVGNALDFGSLNVVISDAAAQVFTVSAGTATIKASVVNGGSITTTGTITLGGTTTTGTTALTGSNGVSGLLQLTGLTAAAVYVKNNSGAQFAYSASVTGTYEVVIPFGSTGSWSAVTKQKGYRHAYSNFTASTGGTFLFAPSMPEKLNPDGSAMYLGTTSALCAVSFAGTTQANIDMGDGTVSLQAAFDETEDALVTNNGMIWLASGKSDTSQFNSAGGDYLFLSTGWRLRRATAGDANATLNAFAVSADGTVVDDVNGGVQFLTSDSPTAIAAAVWAHVTRTLTVSAGGATLAEIEGSTVLAKEATVAAKASQASVNAIPTTPLLAANYTAPANADIAAIKAKTDTLVNTDLTGIATAANVSAAQVAIIAEVDQIPTTPLLAANYTAPDNAGITAIKAKTDNLPANTATVLTTIDSTTKTTLAVSA